MLDEGVGLVNISHASAKRLLGVLVAGAALSGLLITTPSTAAAPVCTNGQVVLTFDDGPDPATTPPVVTLLRERHVPGAFFVVGEEVLAHPAVVRSTWQSGFTIGNHTFRHQRLVRLSDDEIRATIRRTQRSIRSAGAQPSGFMRPPYGDTNARVGAVVRGMGLVLTLWNVDPRDWDGRSASSIASSTLAQLHPRARNVVLFHDGSRNARQTLLALPRIIRVARDRGYCFARL